MQPATAVAIVGSAIHAPRNPKQRSLEEAMYAVTRSALLDAGMAFVHQLSTQPASSVSAIKQLLRRVDAAALDAALDAEGRAQVKAASGPDFAARAHAFLTRKKG